MTRAINTAPASAMSLKSPSAATRDRHNFQRIARSNLNVLLGHLENCLFGSVTGRLALVATASKSSELWLFTQRPALRSDERHKWSAV